MMIFGCSKYKIDQAQKFSSLNTGIKLPLTGPKTRVRMDTGKAEHFLDFLVFSDILQDVAYGATKVTFQSGEEQRIAHTVTTSNFNHIIAFYKQYCDSTKYTPLSDSILWGILYGINSTAFNNRHTLYID